MPGNPRGAGISPKLSRSAELFRPGPQLIFVLLPFFDPLLAVVALSTCHGPIVMMDRVQLCEGKLR